MAYFFISYRHNDAPHPAGRLAGELERILGNGRVFMDIGNIAPGDEFDKELEVALSKCVALLVVIGSKKWLAKRSGDSAGRLHDPNDWVRKEIETAMDRRIPVVPLLIDNARLPDIAELPTGLDSLVRRQALPLRHRSFRRDVEHLAESLVGTISANQFETLNNSEHVNRFGPMMQSVPLKGCGPKTPLLLPLSPPPNDFFGLDEDASVELIKQWFFENFTDPAHGTPYDGREGGYLYIHGGPFDTEDEIRDVFEEVVPENVIDAAVEAIQEDGTTDWAPSPRRIVQEDWMDEESES